MRVQRRKPHDHRRCLMGALSAAARLAAASRLKLTEGRRRVLAILARSHKPLGAYEILDKLQRETRARIAPPTVYRALEFLRNAGLVHRIDTKNAYLACFERGRHHGGVFLICESCGQAHELDDPKLEQNLSLSTKRLGFSARRRTVEISGICAACRLCGKLVPPG